MASYICKLYGAVDLIAAALIVFGGVPIPDIAKYILAIIFVIKGVPSLFA